jgi:RHS repeat-associated protein
MGLTERTVKDSGTSYHMYLALEGSGNVHPLGRLSSGGLGAIDGSGITGLTNKQGTQFTILSAEDTNGNEMSWSPSNYPYSAHTMTDTLGRSWITSSLSSNVTGCPAVPVSPTSSFTWTIPGPSGGTRIFKFCYSPITIQTHFNISGVAEFSSALALITGVVLPDGTTWRFDYDNYGNLTAVYPPTAGRITYTWNMIDDGCIAGGAMIDTVASRTLYDGISSYVWHYATTMSGVTVTDPTQPVGNDTVSTRIGDVNGNCTDSIGTIKSYIGSAASGNLLKTVTMTYQDLPDPYPSDLSDEDTPDPQLLLTTTTTWANGQVSKGLLTYDCGYFSFTDGNTGITYTSTCGISNTTSYGLNTSSTRYDFGSGAPGQVLSTMTTTYRALDSSGSAYRSANLLNLLSSQIIKDASGNECAETAYGYDESAADSSGVTMQHVAAPNSVRGNLTSVTQQLFTNPCSSPTPSKTPLKTTKHVYDTGMVHTSTDPNNSPPTTYSYSGTYYGAYPTSVCNALNQCTTYGYDFNTGLMTTMTDPNNQSTSYPYYDAMLRLLQANFPDNGQTKFIYANPTTVEMQKLMSGTTWTDSFIYYDGLGRESRRMSKNDETIPWDQVDTCYDADGRVGFKSYPYQGNGTSAPKVCSGAGDAFLYDPLARATRVTHSDGSTILTSYTGRATSVQDEGNGGQRVQRISQVDGLGRLTSLCEVSGSLTVGISGSQSASPCNLDIGGTGFLTTYAYDALSNLKSVSQGPLNSRSFLYDSLSRLTEATNPESGSICYGTYSGSTCQQNGYDADSNLIYKTDARNVTTTYSHDQLNRLTQKSYSDGTTSTYYYSYDVSPTWASGLQNLVGRLVYSANQYGGVPGKSVVTIYSYDSVGRILMQNQQTPVIAPNGYFVTFGYDLAGDMTSLVNGLGQTLTYTPNRAQRVTALSTNATAFGSAGSLFGSTTSPVHYNAAGSVVSASLGNGISETRTYDGRLRLTGITDGSVYSVTIPTSGGYAPNSDILLANDSVNGNWTYTYEAFNRLASASATGQAYTYAYDRFGNRWKQNGPHSSQPGFDANNHMVPGLGVTYDAAGDTTNDGTTTYTYDGESRIATASNTISGSSSYVYDADGKRVEKTTATGGTVDFLYDAAGHEIAQVNSSRTWTRGEVYAAGHHVATLNNNTTYYNHSDWLRTERARSTSTGAPYETCTSLPFGDWLTCTGGDPSPMHFTGKERDSESGLDNFGARYNSSQYGRFMTPDPAGLLAVDIANPQSWNQYSYVLNNPLNFVDPTGMYCEYYVSSYGDNSDVESVDAESSSGECSDTGGQWFDPINQQITVTADDSSDLDTSSASNDSGPQSPGFWQRTQTVNQCAASTANNFSFAALTHTQNVPILGSLLSNYFSSASQLAFGPNRAGGAGSLATNAASFGVGPAGKAAGAIPVSSGFQFLFSSTAATTFSETAVGKLAIGGVGAIADVSSGEALVQYFYDAGTYATALVACSIKGEPIRSKACQ